MVIIDKAVVVLDGNAMLNDMISDAMVRLTNRVNSSAV